MDTASFESYNTLTAYYIANGQSNFIGKVMADFTGDELIEKAFPLFWSSLFYSRFKMKLMFFEL